MKAIVVIKGGVAECVMKDKGIELVIIDHDTGCDEPDVTVHKEQETIR